MLVKIHQSWTWHHRGAGERRARAEHARVRAEQPDTAEARLTETEFVRYFVAARPGIGRYVAASLLLAFIGLPASCAIDAMTNLP